MALDFIEDSVGNAFFTAIMIGVNGSTDTIDPNRWYDKKTMEILTKGAEVFIAHLAKTGYGEVVLPALLVADFYERLDKGQSNE